MAEAVAIWPKMFSIVEEKENIKKAKGVKNCGKKRDPA